MASPALAARVTVDDPARAYVQARAAALSGDSGRAAELLGALAELSPSNKTIARQALAEAIAAGNMPLALRLARNVPVADLSTDARLLIVADEVKRGETARALGWLDLGGDAAKLTFLAPLISAWGAAERGDIPTALASLDASPATSLLSPFIDENRAFILLKARRPTDAAPHALKAVETAGGREMRLRIALADGFLAAGDQQRALAMVGQVGTETGRAKRQIVQRRSNGSRIDRGSEALAEVLMGLAVDLNRMDNKRLALGMVQVARYADPGSSAASVLLALMLDGQGYPAQALDVLRSVRGNDPLSAQAKDTAARILADEKRFAEALAMARAATADKGAGTSDWARLGDVYQAMDQHDAAADAYGRAIAFAVADGLTNELWPLYLLRASAFEAGGRWPEAKSALNAGLAIAPEQPLLLNFLGYTKLERSEDLDVAEAMIRKASALAPDDAAITDSLGWALYKRGRLGESIETLQRAAAADPTEAEIHEHLGDALYKVGRRRDARFAWNAALVTADDEIKQRVTAKLEIGLTPATAAP